MRNLPLLFLPASAAYAQSSSDASGAGAALGCLACSGMLAVLPFVVLALNIALLVWVARDAKARGMDNSVVWMILVLFTSLLGAIIYYYSRPKGELIPCPNCGNKRLQASVRCPHCGAA